jgi:hypothetical protein
MDGYKALVNPDTKTVYSVVSDRYRLVRHEDLLASVEEAISLHPEYGRPVARLEFSNDGGRMWAEYVFPEVRVPVGEDDMISPRVVVHGSYDTSASSGVDFGAWRLVCRNGLTMGEKTVSLRRRHTAREVLPLVMEQLDQGLEVLARQARIWTDWTERPVRPHEYEEIMEGMELGRKATEELHREVETACNLRLEGLRTRTLTWWVLFNILTHYVTHRVRSLDRRVRLEARLRRVFRESGR